ncbi:hypothetical protein [Thiobacillus sp.]|uniref:hypothetical protein n=1 Tax=Thiobacillus sp. TaxID=924 RepID=UPI0011D90245|nr:hypothetical protein [Thiobacillus sp.]TXH74950.1 MAG: hypothetical protein E6Q82_08150 [Thiobacillus sp.]
MTSEQIATYFVKLITYGGGCAAVAYGVFQYLGKKWIENRFAERLDQLRHSQALEVQRLRVKIDSMLSGTLKIQSKEFEVLPEAWIKLDEAFREVSQLACPSQLYTDLDRLRPDQLEEFLAGATLRESGKEDIRQALNKTDTYLEARFWLRLREAQATIADFHKFVARNSVFMPPELKKNFERVSDELWAAMVSKEVGHGAHDWKMQNEGWDKLKKEVEPLKDEIHDAIYQRLQAHGRD